MKPLAVLRPEPGNSATAARIVASGGFALQIPLFAVRPLAWTPVPPEEHDALILTSANAVRQAGPALARYRTLPVYAVGSATARAAQAAGLALASVGQDGVTALAASARAAGVTRALHLAGRDRIEAAGLPVARTIAVYASEVVPLSAADAARLADSVALIHSPRAGARLAAVVADPSRITIAAISPAALAAAGGGWAETAVAASPDDDALIAAGLALARSAD